MSEISRDASDRLDAGDFSEWLTDIRAALRGERSAQVPCGSCTACCTSSQFVGVDPDETDTLAHIPPELLFPAPGKPRGHFVLPYDERGHCPMLVGGQCSIYDHRPRTCRSYDCRVFAAAGVEVDKPAIARQALRWKFTYPEPGDLALHDAVRSLAQECPSNAGPVEKALRAVEGADQYQSSPSR
ncbi:MAG: YkgJ family cysteine cluster protein [Acidobacteriota bacterium]|nr:YkgJ family cysteine cluster protein [Acidobacteriota bacterium]